MVQVHITETVTRDPRIADPSWSEVLIFRPDRGPGLTRSEIFQKFWTRPDNLVLGQTGSSPWMPVGTIKWYQIFMWYQNFVTGKLTEF